VSIDKDRSAGRWCAICQDHGSHHTDRHPVSDKDEPVFPPGETKYDQEGWINGPPLAEDD
jgi:hypothetical protein